MFEAFKLRSPRLARLMLGVILLWGAKVLAAPEDPIDLDNLARLEFQMLDNPSQVRSWIESHLAGIDRKKNPRAWVRAVFAYGYVSANGFDGLIPPHDAQEAIDLALELGLSLEWTSIRAAGINESSYDKTLAELAKGVEEARVLGDEQALAFSLGLHAGHMLNYRQLNPTMSLLKEAQDILNRQIQPSLIVFHMVKNDLAIGFLQQGQLDAAIGTFQNIDDFYRKVGIRAERAKVLYNLGLVVFKKEKMQAGISAEPYFREALSIASEIHERNFMALSLYGLSLVKQREKKPDEARILAKKSLALYNELKIHNWIKILERQLAETELDAGRYAEALVHADRAQSEEMLSDKKHQNTLEFIQYSAHLGLGDTTKALFFLQKYMQSFKTIAAEKEQEEYNRSAVNLGLQYETERNAALAKQNQLQSEQIELLNKFRIVSLVAVSLTLLVLAVLYVVRRQSQEIRASREVIESNRQDIRSILDNIKIGVFSISDPLQLRVDSDRSKNLQTVLGADPANEYTIDSILLDRSDLDKDRLDTIRACLGASIGENIFTFEANSGHLPEELVVNVEGKSRIIILDWSVTLKNDGATVQRVLVSCRDATDLRAFQQASLVQQRELGLIEELIRIPHERFLLFCASVRKAIEENLIILGEFSSMEVSSHDRALKMIFINLHTIKGGARTLGFKELALWIHNTEDMLTRIRAGTLAFDKEKLQTVAAEIIKRIDEYAQIAKEKLNRDDAAAENVSLSRSFLKELSDRLLMGAALPGPELARLMNLAYDPAIRLVLESQAHLPRLAKDLGKPLPQVQTLGFDNIFLDQECYTILTDSLVHLIRNSMDHGIESPEDRSRHGKSEAGTFTFEGRVTAEGAWILSLSDDGRGLALEKIRAIGIAKGIIAADRKYKATDIADLIFQEGFSTASCVSEISGRGVGMGAVREFIGRLGGTLRIEFTGAANGEYAPFKFSMLIPAQHIRRIAADKPKAMSA